VGAHEGVLGDLLGVRVVAQERHGGGEDPRLVAVHDLLEGGFITAVEPLHQVDIENGFGVHRVETHTLLRASRPHGSATGFNAEGYFYRIGKPTPSDPGIRAFCNRLRDRIGQMARALLDARQLHFGVIGYIQTSMLD
jgi:hypothetical protein